MLYEKRTDYPQLTTPKGVAVWPSLNTPDFKFKKDYGEYHARIRVAPDAPGLEEFRAAAEELRDRAFDAKVEELKREKKGAILKDLKKVDPIKVEVDPETGEETGFLMIRASMNAGGLRKKDNKPWSQKPDIFNAKGLKLKNPPEIGGGSEMKLSIRLRDYFMAKEKEIGVTFDLEAVQLITLQERGGNSRSASDYGFGAEDGDEIEDSATPFTAEAGDDIQDGEGEAGDF